MQKSQLPTEPHETHCVDMPSHTFDQDLRMCCQTQSTIILLAEKHSIFSLMQFTHCHFTGMMSQAGDASSASVSRDDAGCSRLSLLQGSTTGNSFMGLRAGKSSLVRVDGSGFLHARSGPVPLPIRSVAWGRVWPRGGGHNPGLLSGCCRH